MLQVDMYKKGSDGMSDEEYDMTGVLVDVQTMTSAYVGGCSFNK